MVKTTLWLVDFDIGVPEVKGKRQPKRESRRVRFYEEAKKLFGEHRIRSTYSCWGFEDETAARIFYKHVGRQTKRCHLYKAYRVQ